MGGGRPVLAEIAGRVHDAPPEVPLPETIHHHPGRQGIFGAGDPLGQCQSPAPGRVASEGIPVDRGRSGVALDGAGESRFHRFSLAVPMAPLQDVGGGDVGAVGRAVGISQGHGQRLASLDGVLEPKNTVPEVVEPPVFFHGKLPVALVVPDGFLQVLEGGRFGFRGGQAVAGGFHPVGFQSLQQRFVEEGERLFGGLQLLFQCGPLPLPSLLAGRIDENGGLRASQLLDVPGARGVDLHRGEKGLEPVEVPGGQQVVLVVVALGAAHRQPQKDGTDGGGHFAEQDVPVLFAAGLGEGGQTQKGQGHHRFRIRRRQRCGRHHLEELVPGQLFLHEQIVGLVGIEGIDDVVPVAPGVVVLRIAFVTVGVGVTGQVQPVAPPALPVARIGQQTVDQGFIGVGGGIVGKGLHLVRLGRHPQQVEEQPSDQGPAGGRRSG